MSLYLGRIVLSAVTIGGIGCFLVSQAQAGTPQLITKWDTALLIASDGTLWAWGGNESGLMGFFPKAVISETPQRVGHDSDWKQVDTMGTLTLALKRDGSLWGWGWDYGPNFTNQAPVHTPGPKRIGTETNWSQISQGGANLALKSDGSLWGWGQNYFGQIGDGTTEYRSLPVQIGSERDWRKVKAVGGTGFGLKRDGTLWGWGCLDGVNRHQLKPKILLPGTTWSDFSASDGISVLTLVALKSDGTIWLNTEAVSFAAGASVPGNSGYLTQIGVSNDWDKIYAGDNSMFARKRDGTWWVCGQNWAGQLGLGTASVEAFQRLPFQIEPMVLAHGSGTTLVLERDGRLLSWGNRLGAFQSASDASYKIDHKPHQLRKFPAQTE